MDETEKSDKYFNVTHVLAASRSRISPELPRVFLVNNAKSLRGDSPLCYCLCLRDNKVFDETDFVARACVSLVSIAGYIMGRIVDFQWRSCNSKHR